MDAEEFELRKVTVQGGDYFCMDFGHPPLLRLWISKELVENGLFSFPCFDSCIEYKEDLMFVLEPREGVTTFNLGIKGCCGGSSKIRVIRPEPIICLPYYRQLPWGCFVPETTQGMLVSVPGNKVVYKWHVSGRPNTVGRPTEGIAVKGLRIEAGKKKYVREILAWIWEESEVYRKVVEGCDYAKQPITVKDWLLKDPDRDNPWMRCYKAVLPIPLKRLEGETVRLVCPVCGQEVLCKYDGEKWEKEYRNDSDTRWFPHHSVRILTPLDSSDPLCGCIVFVVKEGKEEQWRVK